jgi:hypothetical protein
MTARKQTNDHEQPILTDLEAENLVIRKKIKDREKPILTGSEAEDKDSPPEE